MVYKQITEQGRKKQQRNKEMKTERNWPASDAVSGLAVFWIIALALPSTQKWALMLDMVYPFCMQIFRCVYANIKQETATVMQSVLAVLAS